MDNNQSITFFGISSHHQNGITERRIRLLTELDRTSILTSKNKWPGIVAVSLWQFTLKAAARAIDLYFLDKNGLSPVENMSRIKR